jgi:hypothetical protein
MAGAGVYLVPSRSIAHKTLRRRLPSESIAWMGRCSMTFSLISASSSASSSFRVRISRASAATIPFPMCWAGMIVCWDFAASTAAAATASEERAPFFFSQAWILASRRGGRRPACGVLSAGSRLPWNGCSQRPAPAPVPRDSGPLPKRQGPQLRFQGRWL